MSKIVWCSQFELGVGIIDTQHRDICVAYNHFLDNAADADVAGTARAFHDLIGAYLCHFQFEEDVLRAGGYRHFESHSKVHALFVRRMIGLMGRLEQGETITAEVERIGGRWLISHIRQEDLDYVTAIGDDLNRLVRSEPPPLGRWMSAAIDPLRPFPRRSAPGNDCGPALRSVPGSMAGAPRLSTPRYGWAGEE